MELRAAGWRAVTFAHGSGAARAGCPHLGKVHPLILFPISCFLMCEMG